MSDLSIFEDTSRYIGSVQICEQCDIRGREGLRLTVFSTRPGATLHVFGIPARPPEIVKGALISFLLDRTKGGLVTEVSVRGAVVFHEDGEALDG